MNLTIIKIQPLALDKEELDFLQLDEDSMDERIYKELEDLPN